MIVPSQNFTISETIGNKSLLLKARLPYSTENKDKRKQNIDPNT